MCFELVFSTRKSSRVNLVSAICIFVVSVFSWCQPSFCRDRWSQPQSCTFFLAKKKSCFQNSKRLLVHMYPSMYTGRLLCRSPKPFRNQPIFCCPMYGQYLRFLVSDSTVERRLTCWFHATGRAQPIKRRHSNTGGATRLKQKKESRGVPSNFDTEYPTNAKGA